MHVTYLTSELPYPINHGGLMAAHAVIRAIAESTCVSILVLTSRQYSTDVVQQAEQYYHQLGSKLVCHQFADLNPSSAPWIKAWHYLSGYPRHGFWSEEADRLMAEHITKTGSKVVWCNGTHEAKYLPTVRRLGCKTVLTTQNVESDLVRQQMDECTGMSKVAGWVAWSDMRRLEKMAARWADVITAITSLDHQYYIDLKGPDRAFLLPFGYSFSGNGSNQLSDTHEEANTLCFVGSMDWPHNIRSAQHLVNNIMPLVWNMIPDTRLFLVGKNPTAKIRNLASERVVVTGTVPSVQEYYRRAPVVVVPMLGVAGIKVKLIEAMALGKAIVSTPDGVAGLDIEDGKQLVVANDPEMFANAITHLFRDKETRVRLGRNARSFVAENFSPETTRRQVQNILACLETSPAPLAEKDHVAAS